MAIKSRFEIYNVYFERENYTIHCRSFESEASYAKVQFSPRYNLASCVYNPTASIFFPYPLLLYPFISTLENSTYSYTKRSVIHFAGGICNRVEREFFFSYSVFIEVFVSYFFPPFPLLVLEWK